MIFISHRSTDKAVADMLADFLRATGVPGNEIFCSSLPGNDVKEKISNEIRSALQKSTVNIAILSHDYYQSAYCLNEAGVLWYNNDVPVIPIALPEINSDNMYGFLNNEYKLRYLDSDRDISHIYDIINETIPALHTKAEIITHENAKLRNRYSEYLKTRKLSKSATATISSIIDAESITDDEKIVLYYILQEKIRKVTKDSVINWLHKNEIYNVNVDNAFDLLSSSGYCMLNNDALEFKIDLFRKISVNADSLSVKLKDCITSHTKLAVNTFKSLWLSSGWDDIMSLFVAYIVDERICRFGDRWMAERQMKSIKSWANKYSIDYTVLDNYGKCLQFFIQNDLVYESDWTSYGNPKEYTLCSSLQEFLFDLPDEYIEILQNVKLPF